MTFGFAADGRTNGATLKRLHQVTLAARYATYAAAIGYTAATATKRFRVPIAGHYQCTVVELSEGGSRIVLKMSMKKTYEIITKRAEYTTSASSEVRYLCYRGLMLLLGIPLLLPLKVR